MLMIRMARFGAKKKPFYRLVVIEKERARDSRNIEVVGHYNPTANPAQVVLKHERIEHWTKHGAREASGGEESRPRGAAGCLTRPARLSNCKKENGNKPYRLHFRFGLLLRFATMDEERRGEMKQLIEDIAKALVDIPEEVSVNLVEGEQVTVLELKVAPSDLGKVIGKQGRTARSIRTILGAAGMKLNRRFTLEILE